MSQIIPQYIHPHVNVVINDNTVYTDPVTTVVDTNIKMLTVFRSSMGPDNVITKVSDVNTFKSIFGPSNYGKYGQPLMMPITALSTGVVTASCMRVMPPDAYAANAVLIAMVKEDVTTSKFQIKFKSVYVDKTSFTDSSQYASSKAFKTSLKISAEAMLNNTPDAEGFIEIPIATFRIVGRGIYGNNFRYRIARSFEYEQDYNMKMYSFETLSTTNGLVKIGEFVGGIIESSLYNQAVYINDIMDDQSTTTTFADIQMITANVESIYEKYTNFVKSTPTANQELPSIPEEFDLFFGLKMGENGAYENYEVLTGIDGTVSVDSSQGISYAGGDDGIFASTNPAEVYEAEKAAYINAFNGTADESILSIRRVPTDLMFDANYPIEVKLELFKLSQARESNLTYIDAGIETTSAQIDNIIDEYATFNERYISKVFQHYTTKDPDTNKRSEVTMTYFMASALPVHFKQNGYWIPFVKGNARLTGHIKDSVVPNIDDIDNELKDKLVNARINYFELTAENVYERGTQNTAQNDESDLLEENNVNTLYKLKNAVEFDLNNDIYQIIDSDSMVRFTEREKAKYAPWKGTQLETFNVRFSQNDYEKTRSILKCEIDIQFRGLIKRINAIINVNRR